MDEEVMDGVVEPSCYGCKRMDCRLKLEVTKLIFGQSSQPNYIHLANDLFGLMGQLCRRYAAWYSKESP